MASSPGGGGVETVAGGEEYVMCVFGVGVAVITPASATQVVGGWTPVVLCVRS